MENRLQETHKITIKSFSSHGRNRGRYSRWISVDHHGGDADAIQELEVRAGTGFPALEGELQRHSDQREERRVDGSQWGAYQMQFQGKCLAPFFVPNFCLSLSLRPL